MPFFFYSFCHPLEFGSTRTITSLLPVIFGEDSLYASALRNMSSLCTTYYVFWNAPHFSNVLMPRSLVIWCHFVLWFDVILCMSYGSILEFYFCILYYRNRTGKNTIESITNWTRLKSQWPITTVYKSDRKRALDTTARTVLGTTILNIKWKLCKYAININ